MPSSGNTRFQKKKTKTTSFVNPTEPSCRRSTGHIVYKPPYRYLCPGEQNAARLFRKQKDRQTGKCLHVVQWNGLSLAVVDGGHNGEINRAPPQTIHAPRWRFGILQCLWQVRFATVVEMICGRANGMEW